MQTYSHYIITAAFNRIWRKKEGETGELTLVGRKLPPLRQVALMLGSIMPDIPLILLSISFILFDRMRGVQMEFGVDNPDSYTQWLFDYAFFNEWWVKSIHNLFHGPLMILAYLALGYWFWKQGRSWAASLFWFAIACLLHTALDIPVHYDDGPLIFFPFSLNLRFYSPVSYWDPAHYGNIFAPLEHILILILLIYLVVGWWRSRKLQKTVQ